MPPDPRCKRHNTGISGFAAISVVLGCLAATGPATAQGWDPFSQLDTNRWERRSNEPARRKPQPVPEAPAAPDYAPPAGSVAADGPRDSYLAPPDQRPRFGNNGTYYPQPRPADPAAPAAYGAPAPRSQSAPAAVSAEPLAPLPGAPADAPAPAGTPAVSNPGQPSYAPARQHAAPAVPAQADPGTRQGEFSPTLARPGDALPHELWRGLDMATLEGLMASLSIPPRSPALHHLWRRMMVSDVQAPAGGAANVQFEAVRLEALYRSGLLADIREALAARRQGTADPLVAMLEARSEIGAGRREAGCEAVRRVDNIRRDIPKPMRGQAILVAGYCAAATGNKPAAGLLAELAREEGIRPSPGLAALDAVALGTSTGIALAKDQKLTLIDYRILELAGATPARDELINVATPALLTAIADDPAAAADLRLAAGEAAARLNAFEPKALAALYRTTAGKLADANTQVESTVNGSDTPQRRALLYAASEAERTPAKKVRMIRAFLDSSRRAGHYVVALAMIAPLTNDIGLVPEIGWFAESAIEANLTAANYERARMWTKFAASLDTGRSHGMDHWMALIDITDPDFSDRRGDSLAALERLALMGRFSSDNLHRLATVLDALEYNVPIPLWEAASRTPQPTAGHLPETGVLSELQDAAKKREFARTVLLAMKTVGPEGSETAHMIALGDAIRALKRAGLEADARRLGFEALLPGWPRSLTN